MNVFIMRFECLVIKLQTWKKWLLSCKMGGWPGSCDGYCTISSNSHVHGLAMALTVAGESSRYGIQWRPVISKVLSIGAYFCPCPGTAEAIGQWHSRILVYWRQYTTCGVARLIKIWKTSKFMKVISASACANCRRYNMLVPFFYALVNSRLSLYYPQSAKPGVKSHLMSFLLFF